MNHGAPPIPAWLAHLPTVAGLVVPWITARAPDGRILFGVLDSVRQSLAIANYLCQVCGTRLERPLVLFVRPVDLRHRCTSEPGLHPQCVAYSQKACPMVAGTMTHYRSSSISWKGRPLTDSASAARVGKPADVWQAVWLDTYQPIQDPLTGKPAASFAGCDPLRIRFLGATGDLMSALKRLFTADPTTRAPEDTGP